MPHAAGNALEINLTAVILMIERDMPVVYASAFDVAGSPGLPSGPFEPMVHRTLELGLRAFASEQAGLMLGYVEQLYTFGDRGRQAEERLATAPVSENPHVVSIGYLALTRQDDERVPPGALQSVYGFFPWEDWRGGRPAIINRDIAPRLGEWAAIPAEPAGKRGLTRLDRATMLFALDGRPFDEEKVLERYELLYEAGLVEEARRDGRAAATRWAARPWLGRTMQFDHRRILATALGRLRGKLKYRPLVFELLPERFTLTSLQQKVEAISGNHLHKQNFRRLVESTGLVEATGEQTTTGGRPAALFRFRREVLVERPAPGLRVGARV
ncbi:MAG: NAD regulator [Methylobacterium sp.]|nr:NAD regulator [Methylobacterium sp.]